MAPTRRRMLQHPSALSRVMLHLVGNQTGSTTPLEFGADMARVEGVVTNILGTPLDAWLNEECGADPQAAYTVEVFESSLGTEFAAGDLSGILTADARDATVENLWAGATCIFR